MQTKLLPEDSNTHDFLFIRRLRFQRRRTSASPRLACSPTSASAPLVLRLPAERPTKSAETTPRSHGPATSPGPRQLPPTPTQTASHLHPGWWKQQRPPACSWPPAIPRTAARPRSPCSPTTARTALRYSPKSFFSDVVHPTPPAPLQIARSSSRLLRLARGFAPFAATGSPSRGPQHDSRHARRCVWTGALYQETRLLADPDSRCHDRQRPRRGPGARAWQDQKASRRDTPAAACTDPAGCLLGGEELC